MRTRAIDTFVQQVDRAVAEIERDANLGMLVRSSRRAAPYVCARKSGRRGNLRCPPTCRLPSKTGRPGIEIGQDALAFLREMTALKSQRQTARRCARNSLSPRRASSASSRRPITAGVTPDTPRRREGCRVAELTKASICLSWSIAVVMPEVKDHFSSGVLIFAKA